MNMEESDIFIKASKKARVKKRALVSFITWFAFIFFFMYIDINDGGGIDWAFFPIFGWGIGVLIQCLRAFDYFGIGDKWEKEEIQKEIAKRKKVLEAFDLETREYENLNLEDLRDLRKETRESDFV